MKIGIDLTQLNYLGTGVANYTFNLVKNLLKFDKKNQYHLFYPSLRNQKNPLIKELKKLGGNIHQYPLPPSFFNFCWGKNHFLPIDWFTGYCDIFYFSDFNRPPVNKKSKGITTIHDLTWKLYPQYHTQEIINAHEKKLEKTTKYDDEIVVDSENTKNDLLKLYPQLNPNKVHVIYPGVDERFKKIDDKKKIEKVLKKYLPRSTFHVLRSPSDPEGELLTFNFLLYVGAIEPRKNLDTTIRVFSKLIKEKKYADFKCLIVGKAGWKNENIFQLVKDLELENKVIFVGYVEDEDLPYFYNGAKATVYLSKYEGFGLPPVESAYCQTPVLLYKNSSLKEIFNKEYPYTIKGKEIDTLKLLINQPINPKKFLLSEFSWRESAKKFICLFSNLRG